MLIQSLLASVYSTAQGWVEGAAILGAVAVVATVTAVNDYQKQLQFDRLNAAAEGDAKVVSTRGTTSSSRFPSGFGGCCVFSCALQSRNMAIVLVSM